MKALIFFLVLIVLVVINTCVYIKNISAKKVFLEISKRLPKVQGKKVKVKIVTRQVSDYGPPQSQYLTIVTVSYEYVVNGITYKKVIKLLSVESERMHKANKLFSSIFQVPESIFQTPEDVKYVALYEANNYLSEIPEYIDIHYIESNPKKAFSEYDHTLAKMNFSVFCSIAIMVITMIILWSY